jgi:predicted RNA-binding protein
VNGKISLYENQESSLYKKVSSLTSCMVEVIPAGYEVLTKPLRLNARSIRRFHQKKWYTNKPIIIESDVTREMLTKAIGKIHSTSVIICHEEVEDLVYELLNLLETEVLSYENSFIIVDGEEVWSNDQFRALDQPVNFIINGQLILEADVSEEVLRTKVSAIDILGEVIVKEKKLKGSLQNIIRLNTGTIEEEKSNEEAEATLKNVGELSL